MHYSRAPWEKEVCRIKYQEDQEQNVKDQIKPDPTLTQEEHNALKQIEKFLDLDSELPDKMVNKYETESQGALRIEFSNRGKYLAIACTMEDSKTIIKIFDVEDQKEKNPKAILRGHIDLICSTTIQCKQL